MADATVVREPVRHNVYDWDPHYRRGFVVFNDDASLPMEPITADDLSELAVEPGSAPASLTWSCGMRWYFLVQPDGIALLNAITNRGLWCRKRSADFIRCFVEVRHEEATT